VADFRKLRVWKAAEELAITAQRFCNQMRGRRSATLADQLMRAALSVPANIVEGSAHTSPREYARFLRYALGSVSEVEGHAQLARDLHMAVEADFAELIGKVVDVRMMLHGLIKSVKQRS
jgi:four helix bundle protein